MWGLLVELTETYLPGSEPEVCKIELPTNWQGKSSVLAMIIPIV